MGNKTLTFVMDERFFSLELETLNRERLYGKIEVNAFDKYNCECRKIAIDSSGTIPLTNGSTKFCYMQDGLWLKRKPQQDKKEERTIFSPQIYESSYDVKIHISKVKDFSEILNCEVERVFQLCGDEVESFLNELEDSFWKFHFCEKKGYEMQQAFIVPSGGNVFLLIGNKIFPKFLELKNLGEATETELVDPDFKIDFAMFDTDYNGEE